MEILFVASVAVVVADPPQSRKLFIDVLGLPLEGRGRRLLLQRQDRWQQALRCLAAVAGRPKPALVARSGPAGDVVPQASIEFEVEDAEAVTSAAGELERAGYQLLHHARTEPWGQTVARLLTEDGLIVGISYAPALH